jgi:amidase
MQIAAQVSHAEASAAQAMHDEARDTIRALVTPGTLVVLPTAPCIAPRVDTDPQNQESYRVRVMRLTCIAGLGGLPQITIPVGIVHGCPVGLSFIGWPGGDEDLLDLAVHTARYCGLERT